MQSSRLSVLGTGFLLAMILAGCATEGIKSASFLPRDAADLFNEYSTKPHFRALATTRDIGRKGWATSSVWNRDSAEGAVEAVMRNCAKNRATIDLTAYECRLYAIGDIIVSGMTEREIKETITRYQLAVIETDPDLRDLQPGLSRRGSKSFVDYKQKAHFRVFATTDAGGGRESVRGRSWGYSTVEGATKRAVEECEKARSKGGISSECKLYAIGDIVVYRMSPEDLEAAIKIYKNDVTSGRAGGSTSASDYEVCNFAITMKDGTVSWESQAAWLGSVNEAKRRNLTPDQCAELLGR